MPAGLSRILHVSKVEHGLISDSRSCDSGQPAELSKKNCVENENSNVICNGKRTGGMYSVDLQGTGKKAMTTPKVRGEMSSVWHSPLPHANRTTTKRIMETKSVNHLDKKGSTAYRKLLTMFSGTDVQYYNKIENDSRKATWCGFAYRCRRNERNFRWCCLLLCNVHQRGFWTVERFFELKTRLKPPNC